MKKNYNVQKSRHLILFEMDQPKIKNEKVPDVGQIELAGFTLDLDYFLGYDYDEISLAVSELPPVIEWVSMQLQALTEEKYIKEDQVKEAEADAFFYYSGPNWDKEYPTVKRTQLAVGYAIPRDPQVQKAKRELASIAAWCQRLHNLLSSLRSKLDLIRSSEATKRRAFTAGDENN